MIGRVLALLGASLLAFPANAQDDLVLVGRVTAVTDGDTIKVELDSGLIKVRFDSIDAPEKDQVWGKQARDALSRRVAGQVVELKVSSQDRYDRMVATVYLAGESLNEWMVNQGHAWAYREERGLLCLGGCCAHCGSWHVEQARNGTASAVGSPSDKAAQDRISPRLQQ
jgi:endonuclease YncB( thermonuclease family)